MAEVTPFLALTKPGGGSTGLITPPERVDIDVLNDNFDKIDDWASDWGSKLTRSFAYYGPAASIGSISPAPKDGDTYQESDGNRVLWKRVGGAWVTNENGLYLVRPASVVNGTINPDGSVTLSGAATVFGELRGLFSSRFRCYKILLTLTGGSATSAEAYFRMVAGTSLLTSSVYQNNGFNVTSGGAFTGAHSTNSFGRVSQVSSTRGDFEVNVYDPTDAGVSTQVVAHGVTGGLLSDQTCTVPAAAYDGIAFSRNTQALGGTVKVYAYA